MDPSFRLSGRLFFKTFQLPVAMSKIIITSVKYLPIRAILGKRSTVLLYLILKQSEIYLDEFSGCLEGLLDAVDLLYGAEVEVSMDNIQALLKFSLMYSVDELATLSFQWVTEQMSVNNLFTFCQMGLFIKSIDVERDDILIGCKDFIQSSTVDELATLSFRWATEQMSMSNVFTFCKMGLFIKSTNVEQDDLLIGCKDFIQCSAVDDFVEVGKYWPVQDQDVMEFLINQDLLPMTISIITNWINEEELAVLVLDRIEDGLLQGNLAKLPSQTLFSFFEAMHDACVTAPSLKRVCKLETALIGKENPLHFEKNPIDSGAILKSLEPKLWRKFDVNQMLSLHYHYGITDFFFAELMLDWISFKKPSQKVFDQLWVVIRRSNLTDDYVTVLGNSVKTHGSHMVVPEIDMAGDQYEDGIGGSLSIESDHIINLLTNTDTNELSFFYKACKIRGCGLPNHCILLKLRNAIPCYHLGAESSIDWYHYHHDKVHHWYATEEKQGQRVLLSLVTKNFNTV